jgi:hypothetical protein
MPLSFSLPNAPLLHIIAKKRSAIWAHFLRHSRKKPGFPLQVLGFAYANPVGFPLQSLARAQRQLHTCEYKAFTGV